MKKTMLSSLELSAAVPVTKRRMKNGVPVQRFRKELIYTGQFVKDEDNLEFEVTPDTLKHWEATFSKMKRDGITVPIVDAHENFGKATGSLGEIKDVIVDGDRLVVIAELVGEDAITLAARNNVSLGSEDSVQGGKGTTYDWPITHVAMTNNPVIPGLADWVPLELSKRRSTMKLDLSKTVKVLGIEEDVTPENADTLLLSAVEPLQKQVGELGEEKKAWDGERKKLQLSVKTLKESQPKDAIEPNAQVVKLTCSNRAATLERLQTDGLLDSNGHKLMAERFAEKEAVKLELSRNGSESDDAGDLDDFEFVCNVIKNNKPVKLGESSGGQTSVVLSHGKLDDNALVKDAERRAELAKNR